MYNVSLAVKCICRCSDEGKMGIGRRGVILLEHGREWRLPGLLYIDDLVLCGGSEDDLKAMVGRFADVCSRRGLKVSAGKSKMMVLNGEERLECEVHRRDLFREYLEF